MKSGKEALMNKARAFIARLVFVTLDVCWAIGTSTAAVPLSA